MKPLSPTAYKLVLASSALSLLLGAILGYTLGYTTGWKHSPNNQKIILPSYPQPPVILPITTSTSPETRSRGGCVIGGCSDQICGEANDAPLISTCEYRSIYGCYASATCERQANDQCGWTETPELLTCLENPPEL